jgi:exodeoxyribonuclease-3
MKLAAWNVNSLKVRLDQVLDWLGQHKPDALCLQETKLEDANFPVEAFREGGWQVAHTGQKTYNGVAIVSPHAIDDVQVGIPGFADEQKRLIAGTVNGVRVICAYMPNGQAVGSDKYAYKLAWLEALHDWLKGEVCTHAPLALLGDYNIAPEGRGRPRPGTVGGAGALLGA